MTLHQQHASPSKQGYDDDDEPLPEENLSDDSYEATKHLPHQIAPRNSNLPNSQEEDGPQDEINRDPSQRGASGMAQREKLINASYSGQKVASGRR